MRAVVTGGAGFIGGHLAERLSEMGFEVIILDNFERASMETLRSLPPEVEVRRVDIRDYRALERFLNVDAVFHFAALTDVVESESKKELYWSVNVEGTRNVLEAALKHDADVVFASSAAVYGDLDRPARVDDRLNPLSVYGRTKVECERLCAEYSKKGLRVSVLRIFNVYGERARGGVVKIFIERAVEGKPLIIYGDGESVRDFVYVGDVAEAATRTLNEEAFGKVLNIGTGRPTKVKELAELVSKLGNVGMIHEPPRKGEIRFSLADISLTRELLQWAPKTQVLKWIEEKLRAAMECK